MSLSISTPIIKPVDGKCNLSCSYCYASGLKKDTDKSCMSQETLKSVIDFFCYNQDEIEFIWHGGEPLLAGLNFYRKVAEFQHKWIQQGKKIINFLQTNATLINSEWTDFFIKNNFVVGVSLDGPKEFHDQVRYYSPVKGSYNDVMRGINLLHQAEIFNGVICGVNIINHKFPKEIFNFFIEKNIKKLKFAKIKNIGYCNDISALVILPAQYTDFMITIFDLWLDLDDPEVEIRDIQSVVNLILGGNKRECIYMGKCGQFVTVYSDGSIYACDSFPKINSLYFCNVLDKSSEVRSYHNLKMFQKILTRHKEYCKKCKWYFICNRGYAKDCYFNLDSIKPMNDVCENLKRYFKHISNKLKFYGLI